MYYWQSFKGSFSQIWREYKWQGNTSMPVSIKLPVRCSQCSSDFLLSSQTISPVHQFHSRKFTSLAYLSTFLKYLHSHNQLKHPLTLKLQEHVAEAHQLAVVAWLKIYCDWNGKKSFLTTTIMTSGHWSKVKFVFYGKFSAEEQTRINSLIYISCLVFCEFPFLSIQERGKIPHEGYKLS